MSEQAPTPEKNISAPLRAFIGRLTTYESSEGSVSDKDTSPLRSLDGAFLSRLEIGNLFMEAVYAEAGVANRSIARHLFSYFVEPAIAALSTARRNASEQKTQESATEREVAGEVLISEMKAILTNLEQYGIDINAQHEDRPKLQYVSESGDRDNFETLDALMADEEGVPDPLYINGMLPDTKVIADACKRLYEKWYPENEGEAHTARVEIKKRCIDQAILEITEVEQNRAKASENLSSEDKLKLLDEKVQKLTTLMRQLSKQEYMQAYVRSIAFGPDTPGLIFPEDMVQLDSLDKRLPFNFGKRMPDGPEKTEGRVAFYRNIYKAMGQREQKQAIREFDEGKNTFFKDNAGEISPAGAYAKLEMVFKIKGFTDEEISQSCAAYMEDVVTEMTTFAKELEDLHEQRKSVQTHEEFVALNKQINEMKGNKKGLLRKKVLTRAKNVVENLEYIREVPIHSSSDNVAQLDESSESFESENESVFAFNYDSLHDRDSRIIEGKEFVERVDALLQVSLDSATGNVVAQDDSYIALRDTYPQTKKALMTRLNNDAAPSKREVSLIIRSIEEKVTGMIAKIEAATVIEQTESLTVDSSEVAA